MGEQARKFLESELYRVMQGFADQDADGAKEELETVDPNNMQAIVKLQNDIKVARWFKAWLLDLVHRGDNAIDTYNQQREQQ